MSLTSLTPFTDKNKNTTIGSLVEPKSDGCISIMQRRRISGTCNFDISHAIGGVPAYSILYLGTYLVCSHASARNDLNSGRPSMEYFHCYLCLPTYLDVQHYLLSV